MGDFFAHQFTRSDFQNSSQHLGQGNTDPMQAMQHNRTDSASNFYVDAQLRRQKDFDQTNHEGHAPSTDINSTNNTMANMNNLDMAQMIDEANVSSRDNAHSTVDNNNNHNHDPFTFNPTNYLNQSQQSMHSQQQNQSFSFENNSLQSQSGHPQSSEAQSLAPNSTGPQSSQSMNGTSLANTAFAKQSMLNPFLPIFSSAPNDNFPMQTGLVNSQFQNPFPMHIDYNDPQVQAIVKGIMMQQNPLFPFMASSMMQNMNTFQNNNPEAQAPAYSNADAAAPLDQPSTSLRRSSIQDLPTTDQFPFGPQSQMQPQNQQQQNFLPNHNSTSQISPNVSMSQPSQSMIGPSLAAVQNIKPQAPPNSMTSRTQPKIKYPNAYSSSGFNMMEVLMRVATRKDPGIDIGAVDLSCTFVVCDVNQHDTPIVYCSENFERLTGYTKHEILGRNCRFLQSPDGQVQAGKKRIHVDDDIILLLKNMVTSRQDVQVNVINYRKGGQPFMNLLTMIPIAMDTDEIKFYVGFQVDLVEQPNSVTSRNPDGTYVVNYQRGLAMPRYISNSNQKQPLLVETGQTVAKDQVSNVLSTITSGESELSKRIWDKVLIENTDDVVFVLSLKGLFLYLSPSSKRVLEYDAKDLMGTALSGVCHPSDIIPVMRELKDTAPGSPVNVVFRILRRQSGYMWFEGYGSLHTEQGKGRKSVVLIGRERPVYCINKNDIISSGGINENEAWTKLSTSGMFLFVSSNIRSLIDRTPQDLIGTSIQALMRPDSRAEFLRVLEIARTGRKASTKHELLNRRGQVLQAHSTVYPGDATRGTKPTFFVVQTRLLKYTRPAATNAGSGSSQDMSNPAKQNDTSASGTNDTSITGSGTNPESNAMHQMSYSKPGGSISSSPSHMMTTFDAVTTYAGQDGLRLGNQSISIASEFNLFHELKSTRSSSWQFELHAMEKSNRILAEELQTLLAARKKRKRRKAGGQVEKDCANCHTRTTPEWRRGPSGNRDLCNSCGLRWAKQQGRISPRTNSQRSAASGASGSPRHKAVQRANAKAAAFADSTPSSGPSVSAPARNSNHVAAASQTLDSTIAEIGQQGSSASGRSTDEHVSKAAKTDGPSLGESGHT